MEKPVQTSSHHVESSAQARLGEGILAEDDGGDPPPIPSAGSTSKDPELLNEKSLVGARSPSTTTTHQDGDVVGAVVTIHDWAHTVSTDSVAHALGTSIA